jgi:membrane-bound serine protease (ClpP class)
MWSRRVTLAAVLASITLQLLLANANAEGEHIALTSIEGPIDPLSARHLQRSIDSAASDGAQLLIVELDTPGGLLSSTRDMVESLLGAQTPVAVYVSPGGSQAASAGTFIMAAANFAVMAPGTNVGAASPVDSGGKEIPETLAKKINQDTAAFIRSIAEARDRNIQALEETVTLARSYSAMEAVDLDVADFIASDITDLLQQVDGRSVETAAGSVTVQSTGLEIRKIKSTVLDDILNVLANPNIAFLLLVIGGLGVLVEVITPGMIGPGLIGIIALILAFLGLGNLSVNWVGVALILLSMVFFYVETIGPGTSIFGIGGIVCVVIGALLLFGGYFSAPDIEELRATVNPFVIATVAGLATVSLVLLVRMAKSDGGSSSAYISVEEGELEGEWGEVVSDLTPSGKVWVADHEWTATSDEIDVIRKGEEVVVIAVYGDVLKVARLVPEQD